MLGNILHNEESHSLLDKFERHTLSITLNTSFEQKNGPVYAPIGPTLDFEVVGDRTNFIGFQNIYLEFKYWIFRPNGHKLLNDEGIVSATYSPFFVSETLHCLFSGRRITAKGNKVSSANGIYAHKAFIETEFSHNKETKDTWLKCQDCPMKIILMTLPKQVSLTGQLKRGSPQRSLSLKELRRTFSRAKNTWQVEFHWD